MKTKVFSLRFLAISILVIAIAMVGITAAFAQGGIFGGGKSSLETPVETRDSGMDSVSDVSETPEAEDAPHSVDGTLEPEDDNSSQTELDDPAACQVPVMDTSRNGSEAEFYGKIEAIQNGTYTISGLLVATNAVTEINGNFVNGDFVKVHATLQADGSYLAREIESAAQCQTPAPGQTPTPESSATPVGQQIVPSSTPAAPVSNEWEFYGSVSAINGDLWTIDGNVVRVDGQTMFRGSPVVGSRVEVKAYRQGDGSWLAVRIKLED